MKQLEVNLAINNLIPGVFGINTQCYTPNMEVHYETDVIYISMIYCVKYFCLWDQYYDILIVGSWNKNILGGKLSKNWVGRNVGIHKVVTMLSYESFQRGIEFSDWLLSIHDIIRLLSSSLIMF